MTEENEISDNMDISSLALDRKGKDQRRAVLNMLTESTFFYNEDDPDLFFFLRRNQSGFNELFEKYFGWRLYVDEQVARLLKERNYNEKLHPSQRFLFDLRRRDECLLFTLLLEFYEEETRRQGVGPNDPRNLHFLLADFVINANRRAKEELGEQCPSESKLFESIKPLFEQLDRYRFIRLVERSKPEAGDNLPPGMEEHLLFEFLPGIRCYDASQAAKSIVIKAYKNIKDEPGSSDNPIQIKTLD